jgi:hypothetical protein
MRKATMRQSDIRALGGADYIEQRARAKYARDGQHDQPSGAEITGNAVSLYNINGTLATYTITPCKTGFRLI